MTDTNCYRCMFFKQSSRAGYIHDGVDPRAIQGVCFLNPKHIEVTAAHFCGQFFGSYANTRGVIEEFSVRKNQIDQQARAIKAEKALKAARAEIRLLKQ